MYMIGQTTHNGISAQVSLLMSRLLLAIHTQFWWGWEGDDKDRNLNK
jgi:hypothetical protein